MLSQPRGAQGHVMSKFYLDPGRKRKAEKH